MSVSPDALREAAIKAAGDQRPETGAVIEVRTGELPRVATEAEVALPAAGTGIYQREEMLVRVVKLDKASKQGGVKREAGSVIITAVTKDYLSDELAMAARFEKFDARVKGMRRIDPPPAVASTLLARLGKWSFPILDGIVTAPTLRADGSLLARPGYDEATGLFGAFDPTHFPIIRPKPSEKDARAALATLRDLFSECAFDGGPESAHAAVAIAATITACIRRSLPIAPAFAFSAPKRGTGKTTAAQAVGQVATGSLPAVLTWSKDEAEQRKELMSILLAGDNVVLIDNIDRPVESAPLCAAITGTTFRQRILGVTEMGSASTAVTWLLTGNHLEMVGDLTTRTLLCLLDAEVEYPEERSFNRQLDEYIAANRGKLLAAALTIPLAYLAAGSPAVNAPRSRFADWDRLVRRPLYWLGVTDPLSTQSELRGIDTEREDLLSVLRAWKLAFDTFPTTVATAVKIAEEQKQAARPGLHDALHAVAGDRSGAINRRRLGHYLKRMARRIEAGLRVEDCGEDPTTKTRRYRVTAARDVGDVGDPANEREGNCSGNSPGTDRTTHENPDNPVTPPRGCPRCAGEGCRWCQGAA